MKAITAKKASLAELRKKICDIDGELLRLLKERVETARQIGLEKTQYQIPVKDPEMEDLVRDRNRATAASLGLYEDLADELSELLIRYAVRAQVEA